MPSPRQVLLCTNFEEAADIYSRYSDNIIGLITDAGSPARLAQPCLPSPPAPAWPSPAARCVQG